MGFRPVPHQQYFLVAKNSHMPLGVRDPIEAPGAFIEQQNFEPEFVNERPNPRRKRQYFRFDAADYRQVFIRPGGNDLFLDEQNCHLPQSHNDGTPLIQYTWDAGAHHQRFQPVSAGNGYYRLQALHAPGQFLDVLGNTNAPGNLLTLVRYTGTENQLFALLPATPAGVAPDPRPLQRVNEDLRNTVLMVAGMIPSVESVPVGSALKFIIGFFWKGTDHEQDFWNQMKAYVDERIGTLVRQNELDNMRARMMATLASIESTRTATPDLKAGRLENHIMGLELDQAPYLYKKEGRDPSQVLPHLVGMGTVLLTLLRQRIVNYDELYLTELAKTNKAANVAYYKAELRKAIARYVRAAVEGRAYALDWRRKQVGDVASHKTHSGASMGGGSSVREWSEMRDHFDGWAPSLDVTTNYGPYGQSTTEGRRDHRPMLDYLHAQRVAQVEVQFRAELEVLLNGARLWKYFDSDLTTAPVAQVRTATVGSFGGRRAGPAIGLPAGVALAPNVAPGASATRLTRVVVHTGGHGVVSGLEFSYGPTATGILGAKGGRVETLELPAEEFITGVYGTFLEGIDSICFETNRGRRATGGRTTGFTWSADLPDALGAALVAVTGTVVNGDIVERLSFEWAYAVLGDDLPALADLPLAAALPPAERPAGLPAPDEAAVRQAFVPYGE